MISGYLAHTRTGSTTKYKIIAFQSRRRERDTSEPFAAASRVECSVEPMRASVGFDYKSNARI